MDTINQKITFRELVINPQFRKYSGFAKMDSLFDIFFLLKTTFGMKWSEIEKIFYETITE